MPLSFMTDMACSRYPITIQVKHHHACNLHGAEVPLELEDSPHRYCWGFFRPQGRRHRKPVPFALSSSRSMFSSFPYRSGSVSPRRCPLQCPIAPPLFFSPHPCAHSSAAPAACPRTLLSKLTDPLDTPCCYTLFVPSLTASLETTTRGSSLCPCSHPLVRSAGFMSRAIG